MSDKLLTVSVVARQLGLTTKSVYRLIDSGDLDVLRMTPRTLRVPASSVALLLERRLAQSRYDRGLSDSPEPDSKPSDSAGSQLQ